MITVNFDVFNNETKVENQEMKFASIEAANEWFDVQNTTPYLRFENVQVKRPLEMITEG